MLLKEQQLRKIMLRMLLLRIPTQRRLLLSLLLPQRGLLLELPPPRLELRKLLICLMLWQVQAVLLADV